MEPSETRSPSEGTGQPAGPVEGTPAAPDRPGSGDGVPPGEGASPGGSAGPAPEFGRRRFLRFLVGFSIVSTIGIVVTPILGFLVPPRTQGAGTGGRLLAGTTDDIPPGQGKVVAMGAKPVIVVNGTQGVKAFSAICTHLGCIVSYDSTSNQIVCPCHGGVFNPISGVVVAGPPPAPLAPVDVAVEDKQIFLVGG